MVIEVPGMEYDHIVIGAGVLGAATAYHLKRLEPASNILLIEKEQRVGSGNTAKSAALFRNIFSSRTNQSLSTASIRYYMRLGNEVQLRPIGYLWTFSEKQWMLSQEAISKLDAQRDMLEFHDKERMVQTIRIETSAKGSFPDVHMGIFGSLCGSLSGMALAEHYSKEFSSLGGEVRTGVEVKDFLLRGRESKYAPWADIGIDALIDAENNELRARSYVSCTGAWTQQLLGRIGIFSGTLPKKRQLFGIKVDDPSQVVPGYEPSKMPAVILPAGGTYIKPILDRKLMLVGLADELGQPFDMSAPGTDQEYFEKAVAPVLSHYFPALKDWELRMRWYGYYSYHWPDKNPVVESVANLTWLAGCSGSGIMKADALGRITASKVLGMAEARLYDGTTFPVSSLSLRRREVDQETFVI